MELQERPRANDTGLPSDPMVKQAEDWVAAYKEWGDLAALPEGGNFDTPRMLELDSLKEDLLQRIRETPISSNAGFAAYCRFVSADNFAGHDDYPDIPRWQWEKVQAWAEANAAREGRE